MSAPDIREMERRLQKLEDRDYRMRQQMAPAARIGGGGGGGTSEYLAQDRADLELALFMGTIKEGAFCRTVGTVKRAYKVIQNLLICYTHGESS